jgi:class III poly(R)-hydroxyalkanoic acid synthase PhaE subunit
MMQSTNVYGNLYFEFMNSVFEAASAMMAKKDSDEQPDEIYENLSKRWLELYQESVGKYLTAPQFGIQRESIQQFNASIAAFHRFMAAGGDFLLLFSKPLMQSMDIIQQALQDEELLSSDLNSAKDIYSVAVKILDKEYDEWLKSPEGVRSVGALVDKYMDYKKSYNPVRDSWFKSLAIPTKQEMEDVYKGIYDLKKTSRQQQTVIREQNDAIKKLEARIRKLEDALAKSAPNKERTQARKTKPNKKKKSVSK